MQRSYNAFAVRVQGEEGSERRIVPASETDEGELCIEMRIRLYPDGLMSGVLLRLIKVRRRDGRLTAGLDFARGGDRHYAVLFSRLPRMGSWLVPWIMFLPRSCRGAALLFAVI